MEKGEVGGDEEENEVGGEVEEGEVGGKVEKGEGEVGGKGGGGRMKETKTYYYLNFLWSLMNSRADPIVETMDAQCKLQYNTPAQLFLPTIRCSLKNARTRRENISE